MIGSSSEEVVNIQPPLLQVVDRITSTAANSADKARSILKVIAQHLGAGLFVNLGIRYVYHAPAPQNSARDFLLHRVLSKTEEDLGDLQQGGSIWAGIKYGLSLPDRNYTIVIEPLWADPELLFIDLDAQFPGQTHPDAVKDRAAEAEHYIVQSINSYLDKIVSE